MNVAPLVRNVDGNSMTDRAQQRRPGRNNRFQYEGDFKYLNKKETTTTTTTQTFERTCLEQMLCCCCCGPTIEDEEKNISLVEKGAYRRKKEDEGPSISSVLQAYDKYRDGKGGVPDKIPDWCVETNLSSLCLICCNNRVSASLPCCNRKICGRCIQIWILNCQNCTQIYCLFCNGTWPRERTSKREKDANIVAASLLCDEQ